MATLDDVIDTDEELNERLHYFQGLKLDIRSVADLESLDSLRSHAWSSQAGVYALLYGSHVRYIGRALKGQGLAARLWEHIRSDERFRRNAESEGAPQVAVFALHDHDAWLAPSLELLLHRRTRRDGDLWNKKRC